MATRTRSFSGGIPKTKAPFFFSFVIPFYLQSVPVLSANYIKKA
jgi:hypothetical protein